MSEFDYDLFVIGGGSGGVRAARIAAGHGAKVAIAEEYRFGGTCVIRGCVPKKLLVYASRFRDEFEDAAGFGWSVEEPHVRLADPDRQQGRRDRPPRRPLPRAAWSGPVSPSCRPAPSWPTRTRWLCSPAAARSRPAPSWSPPAAARCCPILPGAGHAITSNEAFHLESLPKSILIVGGGYIAVEFAGIFNGLGVDTTLLYRGPKILRGFDEELRDALTKELFKREIDVQCNAEIAAIEKGWSRCTVTLKDGSTLDTGLVMFATGRTPNTAGIGLEAAGVKLGDKGEIVVDALLALLGREHLRRRRRHRPRQPHAGRHPRGPRLRRHRVRQQADHRRPRAGPDRRVLHARDRHRRPARARRARALPQARRLQGALPPAQAHAVGPRRAHAHEAARRRRERSRRRLPRPGRRTRPRSCRWRPSPCT